MDFKTTLRVFGPVWIMPPLVAGSFFLAFETGGWFESLYVSHLLPWLVTTWIGAGFTCAWEVIRETGRAQAVPPIAIAAVGVLGALFILSQLGGFAVIWEDPWIFGVAVWPGLRLAAPALQKALASGLRKDSAVDSGTPSR